VAIVTVSRGSYSRGKEVAEKVAARLDYTCVGREVILDASDRFNIPEVKLVRAIHDAPSILDRFSHGKQTYIAYMQCALARRARQDDMVYHGLAGHLLLKGVPHVLKVRIVRPLSERVADEMKRKGVGEREARSLILRDDEERRKWTQTLYGKDPWDASMYDLILRIHKLTVADAVDFICKAVGLEQFRATPEARRRIGDLSLACDVKAALVDQYFDVSVTSEFGNVLVFTKAGDRMAHKLEEKVKVLASEMEGIHNVEVHAGVPAPEDAV